MAGLFIVCVMGGGGGKALFTELGAQCWRRITPNYP